MGFFEAKKEKKKIEEIIRSIPDDRKKFVAGLIADVSFMAEQLEILREHINKNGWSEEYYNGANQHGRKNSVEAEAYIKIQKAYSTTMRQLTEFLPDETASKRDELLEFLNSH